MTADTLNEFVQQGAESLRDALERWPQPENVGNVHESNIALHLAPILLQHDFAVFSEAPVPPKRRGSIDLLALHVPEVLVAVECKYFWDGSEVGDILDDLERLRNPEILKHVPSVKQRYGILAALCQKQSIVDWWEGDMEHPPPNRTAPEWVDLGRQLEDLKAQRDSVSVAGPQRKGPDYGDLKVLYAMFAIP